MRLRIGIIGAGNRGAKHAASYLSSGRAKIAAVCDPDLQKARQCADQYGAIAFGDYRALLRSDIVDAVSICAPTPFHAEIGIEAAASGLHILCEKPLARSLAECDLMIDAAARANVLLGCNFQSRFFPRNLWLREKVIQRDFGGKMTVHARGWTIHLFDLISFFIGPVRSVLAQTTKSADQDVGSVLGLFLGSRGDVAAIEALPIYLLKHSHFPNSLEVIGSWASAQFSLWKDELELRSVDSVLLRRLEGERNELIKKGSLLVPGVPDVCDFVSAILDGTELAVSGVEGRKSVELVTAMHAAASEERAINLPLLKDTAAYFGHDVYIAD